MVSNFLQPRGLQHARLPCPSPSPRDCSNSCPLSQWCHPTILSSVIPFFFCLQSFPASGPFLISQLFESGGQSIGSSASASVLSMNIQNWFSLGLTDFTFLQSKGLTKSHYFQPLRSFHVKNISLSSLGIFLRIKKYIINLNSDLWLTKHPLLHSLLVSH